MFKVQYLLVILAIVALASAQRPTRTPRPPRPTRTPRPTTPQTTARPDPDVIQTEGCGGVLEGASGLIAFQQNLAQPNEVCVWTIRAPSAGQITLQLDSDTFSSDGGAYIAIFSVGDRAVLQKSHKIFSGDRSTHQIPGQVGYIMFRSSRNLQIQTGFQLHFAGNSETSDDSEWTGRNNSVVLFHHDRAQGVREEFSYPDPRARYEPNEFGSWVLNPEYPKNINTLTLYYLDFEDFSCADYINIHQIDGDEPRLLERKCNTNTYFSSSFRYESTREPFIITFHSDGRNERSGFILYYSNDRYSCC